MIGGRIVGGRGEEAAPTSCSAAVADRTRAAYIVRRVWDNDGEFPLIEAAYHLPKGLTPDLAENRVWIRGGEFHVLPRDRPAPGPISLPNGLGALWALDPATTIASHGMRAAIAERLESLSVGQTHVAHALLPARAAALLLRAPQLLPAIVEAFYYRDLSDAKVKGEL